MEKITKPSSGYLFLLIELALLAGTVFAFVNEQYVLGAATSLLFFVFIGGFFIVDPNKAVVFLHFGE